MDERVEAFLADILALEGEEANAIRQGVRGALADYEQLFRAQEVNKRMKEKAAHACHALCRARVVEEIRLEPRESAVASSARVSRAGLAHLVEVQYVTEHPQSERKTLYIITDRGRQALANEPQ